MLKLLLTLHLNLKTKKNQILSVEVDKDILKYENRKLQDSVNFYKKFETEVQKLKRNLASEKKTRESKTNQ